MSLWRHRAVSSTRSTGRLDVLTIAVFCGSSAQTTGYYTEPNTNLTFYLYSASTTDTTGGYSFGYLAPETNTDYEYVGIMASETCLEDLQQLILC